MSTERVDFLFRGSHPSFFWAAALLKKKGKSVAILPQPEVHSWELLPTEALSFLGVEGLKTNRDQNPIQILTKKCRFGVFSDLEFTKKDFNFCSGNAPAPELNRGLSFYAKGSDYQAIFGENSSELLKEAHRMEYFDLKPEKIISQATAHLRTMGIVFFDDDQNLPIAEQTIILDVTRAKVFRTRFEFTLPMGKLPTGASNRMLLVERGSPLIEMIHFDSILHVRTLLPEGPSLVQNMVNAITPYFSDIKINGLLLHFYLQYFIFITNAVTPMLLMS